MSVRICITEDEAGFSECKGINTAKDTGYQAVWLKQMPVKAEGVIE